MSHNGLYIHIPFCKSRCIYCDFYSTTCGPTVQQAFVSALCNEMRKRKSEALLSSIYIGGGTPSVLAAGSLTTIFDTINECWQLELGAEVTLEANPDDITASYAKALASLPVNRVSMGVQTFHNESLRFLNRRHTAQQVPKAIDRLMAMGIDNISIDLIYGLPHQSLNDWQKDLDATFALPVSHISAYALIYENGTPLQRMREEGQVQEADEELSLRMYEMLIDHAASNGFVHYEISNFALPGREARHNSGYWHGMHYLGLGPAAHSYNGHSRQWNSPDLMAYIRANGDTQGYNLATTEVLTEQMQQEEMLLTRLRTAAGLDLAAFRRDFGQQALDALLARANPYINNGTLTLREEALALTRKGLFISDGIISSLFE